MNTISTALQFNSNPQWSYYNRFNLVVVYNDSGLAFYQRLDTGISDDILIETKAYMNG